MVAGVKEFGKLGEKGERIEKYRWVVTKQLQRYKVQQSE